MEGYAEGYALRGRRNGERRRVVAVVVVVSKETRTPGGKNGSARVRKEGSLSLSDKSRGYERKRVEGLL